ncbi:MAG: fibronectin type III domain-containing protein [Candidatus Nealsonbacteria bacterium]|nr:fibronectin type III domain-containing protein [Candidatus Nealsonbacteria bacterium]
MPAVPGSTYSVTGTITAFTSTNSQTGSDADSATITVDNASPSNVTSASGTAGNEQVSLSWTNSGDSDFHSAVVLRRAASAVADTPVEGTTYTVGNTIGTATVACVEATPGDSCTDTGLTNGTAYHYKIFAKDSNGNYSATGAVPTGSPFTPAVPSDTTAPGAVTNLAITSVGQTSVSLSWTSPGDDGDTGTASTYDMRYSTSLITSGNFSSATQATGEPVPSVASSSESMTVSGLSAGTLYYFAIKTIDEALNSSAISNVVSDTTSAAPTPTPEAEAVAPTGPTAPSRVLKVSFFGKAYPGAKVEILRKDTSAPDAPYRTIPLEKYSVNEMGVFDIVPGALLADQYFFGIRAEDKDGRQSRILTFSVDLRTTDSLEEKDIFMPPTFDFLKARVRKGDSIKILGYATPGSATEIEIDDKIVSAVKTDISGYYSFTTSTSQFSFGNHYARTRQIDASGKISHFSTSRVFQVSELLLPRADFNRDETINITDWSIFLFRWGSGDQNLRGTIDMNADGVIDISDFSIFLRNIQL